ncbi:MAG: SPFH domain-containing protein [Desulfatibacillaceae bacterium]
MGFWDKVKGELIDIVEWLDSSANTLVYRFERYGNEIKYGAKLVVREGQQAVFINEGEVADVYRPGTYTLNTQNMPILTTLKGWKYGFESPFKAEVYFVSTKRFPSMKWGTPGPSMMRDQDFGVVRVTAFGIYSIQVKDPVKFIREIVGTDGHFTTEEISANLRGKIGMRIKEVMPELKVPVIEMEGKVGQISDMLTDRLRPEFMTFGLELNEIQVQDLGLPQEVEQAIDKGGAMRAIGNMQAYAQYESAGAIRDAAQNPGGMAGAGMGIGVGFGMGNMMAQTFGGGMGQDQQAPQQAPPGPPPLPTPVLYYVAVNGAQQGPYEPAAIQQMAGQGQLSKDSLVWCQGMANWTPAGQVPDLVGLFNQGPPPVPPPPPAS